MVRASSPSPPPDARTPRLLPPIEEFERLGKARKVRWSPMRKRVLSFLWSSGEAWGVYGIAEGLSAGATKFHPPSVHRAVKCLVGAQLIIPIVSWSRFVISPDPAIVSWAMMICPGCRDFKIVPMVAEGERLTSLARDHGFRPERTTMECIATCRACPSGGG